MKRKNTLVCTLAVLAVLALAGCKEKNTQTAAMPAPLVGLMTVQAQNVPIAGEYVGQTEGSRAVELRAQISGILVRRTYDEGSYVQKGQVLFEIDPDTYKAALEQAEGAQAQVQARYTQTHQDLARIQNLFSKNAVSQRDRDSAQAAFDTAKADMASAKAIVDEAKIKLSYAYVISPVHGYAGKANRSVGNLINSSSPDQNLLTVVNQVDPIYANFSLPSPHYMRMRTLEAQKRLSMANMQAFITLADGSRYAKPGKIIFMDKAVNPETSVVSARAEFPNDNLFVLPGQFVRVMLTGAQLIDAILVPQQAVIQTQKGSMVVVVDAEGKAQMRSVVLSDNIGDAILVEKGLESGERIVVEGSNKAVPGMPVRIDEKYTPPSVIPVVPGAEDAMDLSPATGADAGTKLPGANASITLSGATASVILPVAHASMNQSGEATERR